MTQSQRPSAVRRAGGVLVMLLGAAMIGWGVHFLTISGNCSSTGYLNDIGPVPKCSGGEFFYITATFFVGPFVALFGWGMAKINSLLWPLVCICLGTGLITLYWDQQASTGASSFGLVAGVCFFGLALLSVAVTIKNKLKKPAVTSPSQIIQRPPSLGTFGGPPSASPFGAQQPGSPFGAQQPGSPFGGPQSGSPFGAQQADSPFGGPQPGNSFADAVPPAPTFFPAGQPTAESGDPLDRIARLAQLRDSGALTETEFQREKDKLLGQP